MMMVEQNENPTSDDKEKQITFLVVDGKRVVTLDRSILNIGRKSDNHIVIENEHVSRYHAQIRINHGQYVIQDLNSTVGTSVNGEPTKEAILRPGDVISLGGVPIIFGQGTPSIELESLDSADTLLGDSKPTENTEIQTADKYLDLFDTKDE
jgi:pSer/pThr/pTyr-binding forkhead associated (FHA) protein